MGEVYRATDTNLKREVALKVLPASVAADAVRLARFQREAEVLAALNHPNIAAIYGLEKSDGIIALVMELVEGEDLSQRIARLRAPGASAGQVGMPLDEALPIAKQIAEALEAAHEQGIIHRDLKPANIRVRSDGTVKVLDFGLAKAMEPPAGWSPSMTQSPTLTTPAMTQAGMILGTAAYMAPEQARGATADKRADLWAFGCVLWEMLTGTRLFEGATVSDTLAAVLKTAPDWSALPADTPAPIRTLLRRCLEKDRVKRIADIAVAQFLLNDEGATAADSPRLPRTPSRRAATLVAASLAVAAVAVAVAGWMAGRSAPAALVRSATRFRITLPPELVLQNPAGTGGGQSLALSEDGGQLAYFARLGVNGDRYRADAACPPPALRGPSSFAGWPTGGGRHQQRSERGRTQHLDLRLRTQQPVAAHIREGGSRDARVDARWGTRVVCDGAIRDPPIPVEARRR